MNDKLKTLLLEDVQKDAELLQEILTSEGYTLEMDVVENESDYISKLKRQNYDIIYADYSLPSFNGQQALVLAKNICPNVPFIFISGTIGEDRAVELLKQGATDYVLKDRIHRVGMATKRALGAMAQLKQFRQKEIEIQTSRKLLQNIINNALDSIYVKDLKGRYLLFNEAAERVTGILATEVIGRDDTFIFSESEAKQFKESDQQVFDNGLPVESEGPITMGDGTQRIFHTIKCPMYDDNGRMTGLFGITRDVTDRKLMEQSLIDAKEKAEESDRLKTAFLQNISHEIRTPLNAIVGFSGLLEDAELSREKVVSYIEIISRSSDQLTSIISDIISIATIESGLEKVSEYELDLNDMLRNLNEQYVVLANKQNLTLTMDIQDSNKSNWIVTDGVKLNRILQNLIGNSVKFTEYGSVKMGYSVCDSELHFFVEDTGIGIPEDMLENIFKRFIRVESDFAIKLRGSGLGLSIAKAYVELLGGKIEVTSKLGEGSRFVFTIPYKRAKGFQ